MSLLEAPSQSKEILTLGELFPDGSAIDRLRQNLLCVVARRQRADRGNGGMQRPHLWRRDARPQAGRSASSAGQDGGFRHHRQFDRGCVAVHQTLCGSG